MKSRKHILDLNHDILAAILSLVSPVGLRQFSETCRAAHNLSIPHLLSSITLDRSPSQVTDFCAFMLVDPHTRIPCLRSLTILDEACIALQEPSYIGSIAVPVTASLPLSRCASFAESLAQVLYQARNLTSLTFSHAESILEASPRVSHAILSNCSRLTKVSFEHTGHLSILLLQRLCHFNHQIQTLTLDASGDLGPVLRPLADTLCALTVTRLSTSQEFTDDAIKCPNVKRLTIERVFTSRASLARTFPNLETLELWAGIFAGFKMLSRNIEANGSWTALDHVRGNGVALYFLALACPVRRLEITDRLHSFVPVSGDEDEEMPFGPSLATGDQTTWDLQNVLHMEQKFLSIFNATQPRVLEFRADPSVGDKFYEQMVRICPCVKVLCLTLEDHDAVNATLDALDWLPNVFGSLTLKYLSVHCRGLYGDFGLLDGQYRDRLLRRFASIDTLRYLEIGWDKAGWRTAWWEVRDREKRSGLDGVDGNGDGEIDDGREVREVKEDMGKWLRERWLASDGDLDL